MLCQQFCGCMQYVQDQEIDSKVYTCFFLILIVNMAALKVGTEWFIYKDYYPLKQKSPLLCIVMIAFLTLQILLYPMLFLYNYFTSGFDTSQYLYRMFYYGLDGTVYFIYILRSLRLVYAHTADSSRQNTWIFKMFKHQYYLGIIAVSLVVLRMLPIYFNPVDKQYPFYTMIEFSTPFSRQDEVPFMIKSVSLEFIWLIILMYCLKIQSKTHPKHSMKGQLILIISVNLFLNFVDLLLISNEVDQISLFFGLCNKFSFYPSVEITKSISLIVIFGYSAFLPLMKKKVYHMLLPTGRNYGLTKTMRDFLLEPEFLDIFQKYLKHLDENEGTTKYSQLLNKWKKVMILKFCDKKEEQKLAEIKQLLLEGKSSQQFFQESKISDKGQGSLVMSLIKSIQSLEEPLNLSEQIMIRYRSDVNDKVEELERKLLERLDRIYKQRYHETKSYYHLKMKLNFYKKVNVNMILMKMALMIESDDGLF